MSKEKVKQVEKDVEETEVFDYSIDFNKSNIYVNKEEGVTAVVFKNHQGITLAKSVSHCDKNDEFDLAVGFALCYAKASIPNYHDFIRSFEGNGRRSKHLSIVATKEPKHKNSKNSKNI